jgi:2-phospho-L-lactate guanylyltransferase
VVIVPDRHGTGTNALVLSPPDAIEPSFGPGSLERHVAAAEAAGIPHRVEEIPGLALDVDTPGDLAELSAELELSRGAAPATRGALRQLDRAGAHPVRQPHLSG